MQGYLLDTHTFLWLAADDQRLSQHARGVFLRPASTLYFSIASMWEMAIKASRKKLVLPTSVAAFVSRQMVTNGIRELPVETRHACEVETLPWHHTDPFDRLLAAQAFAETLVLLSADTIFDAYGVMREW